VFARVGTTDWGTRPARESGHYLPPKKPYLTFARKAALVTRKTSTDMGVILRKGDTSFLEVEVLQGFGRFAVERCSTDGVVAGRGELAASHPGGGEKADGLAAVE
jgi:hypothetical protein